MVRPVDLSSRIQQSNDRLKTAGIRFKIEQRGGTLSLRGMLPSKTGDGRKRQSYLATGCAADQSGLAQAYNMALQVWSQVSQGVFDWADWGVVVRNYDSCEEWIRKYRRHWLQVRGDTPENQHKFESGDWKFALKHLPPEASLTADILIQAAQLKKPNSRSRQLLVQGLKRLAKFAKIDVDLSPYQGTYSTSKVKDRVIPTDQEILEDYERFKGSKWRLVFVRMILYGLRDHEAFDCVVSPAQPYLCEVLDGKTGPRQNVIPAYQEWAELWEPWQGELPFVDVAGLTQGAARQRRGERTARQFKRLGVASDRTPYSYRHAYALRLALVYGFSAPEAAKMMGHAPTVYLNTYSRHLDSARVLDRYQGLMAGEDRPRAPGT